MLSLQLCFISSCGSRSGLNDYNRYIDSNSTSNDIHFGIGGSSPQETTFCKSLEALEPVQIEADIGWVESPALALSNDAGNAVSLFYILATVSEQTMAVSNLTPWGNWPPEFGEHFSIAETSMNQFAVDRAPFGRSAILMSQSYTDFGTAVMFSPKIVPTHPTSQFWGQVTDFETDATPLFVAQGYESPPVSINYGFMEELFAWDFNYGENIHGLQYGIDVFNLAMAIGWSEPPETEPNIACANTVIPADAVRVGESWIVVAGTGSDNEICANASNVGPPQNVAIAQLTWGTPDTVTWSTEQTDLLAGDETITRIQTVAVQDGAIALITRASSTTLINIDSTGKIVNTLDVSASNFMTAIAPAQNGSIIASVKASSPDTLSFGFVDINNTTFGTTSITRDHTIGSIEMLSSPEAGYLAAWTEIDENNQTSTLWATRLHCSEEI